MKTIEERFWEKVNIPNNAGECWVWNGGKMRGGYGGVNACGKTSQAHRVSYELHYGTIPEGFMVLHKCDNPPCVNPHHLFLGTNQDNSDDRGRKGRTVKGEMLPNHKLTEDNVSEIRRMISERVPRRKIATLFGVGPTCVTDIATGRTWSWLKN